MKILVVGKGGREHALAWALGREGGHELHVAPGSDAIAEIATCHPVGGLGDVMELVGREGIELVVAGEESYLVEGRGLADLCHEAGVRCWGPSKAGAQLEASKIYSKRFMERHGIPTAAACEAADRAGVMGAIGGNYPTVLKFDGLAAGKGVAICHGPDEVEDFLRQVFDERRFGEGGLLVERCIAGPELSIFCAVADGSYRVLAVARDYKRLGEGDVGLNTGGMGAVSSRQMLGGELWGQIEEEILERTVAGLEADGLGYRGFLYFGLMLTEEGPQVLEYNCRFGDPECQVVMPLVRGDLGQVLARGAEGVLDGAGIELVDGWSVGVILASAGYPEGSRSGDEIKGLEEAGEVEGVEIFHSGTRKREVGGGYETAGGRVLAVVGTAASLEEARDLARRQAGQVFFDGMQKRGDIGYLHFEGSER
jgi:phosphoribosylamine---glycine ligase